MKYLTIFLLLSLSCSTYAANIEVSGNVDTIKLFSNSCSAYANECTAIKGHAWVRLLNVNSAGSCPTIGANGLIFYVPEEDHFILTALMNAKSKDVPVNILVNDTERFHNACKVDDVSY